eukprot:Colp12_sorted_trinity150504_noHs@24017
MVLRDILYPMRARRNEKQKKSIDQAKDDFNSDFLNAATNMFEWFSKLQFKQQEYLFNGLLNRSTTSVHNYVSSQLQQAMKRDFLGILPTELAAHILSFVDDPVTLCRASRVSKRWRVLAEDHMHWQRLCLDRGWPLPAVPSPSEQMATRMDWAYETMWWGTSEEPSGDDYPKIEPKQLFAARYLEYNATQKNWSQGSCTKQVLQTNEEDVTCVTFDKSRMFVGSLDRTVKVWNMETNVCLGSIIGHQDSVSCVAFNVAFIVTGSFDRTLKVWDYNNGSQLHELTGHEGEVQCVAVRGTTAISGSWDNTLRVWCLITGRCITVLRGHLGSVYCVQFDSHKIVSGAGDRSIRIWNFATGKETLRFVAHEDTITSLFYDHEKIVSASYDHSVKIHSFSGVCLRTLSGHSAEVWCLRVSHHRIVSGSEDGTIRVWDEATGECYQTLRHGNAINSLDIDERKIISGSKDGSIQVWDFSALRT